MSFPQHEQLPSTIEEVESLILSLYQPSPPAVISATQSTLSRLQTTPQAWHIAQLLLDRPDEKVKFFGVLTIIVKLNTESSTIGQDDAKELLVHLINWYIASLSSGDGPLVSRKLASALATFLQHWHRIWPHYLHSLVLSLASGGALFSSASDPPISFDDALSHLNPSQIRGALWVASNVVEDLPKLDLNAPNNHGLYEAVLESVHDAVSLINASLSLPVAAQDDFIVRCLQSWIWFAQRAPAKESHVIDSLRPTVTRIINSLSTQAAPDMLIEVLTEVLSNFSTFFTESQYEDLAALLESPWTDHRCQALLQGDFDFESFRFGQFLLAYGDARIVQLMQGDDVRNRRLLAKLSGFLSATGYPVVEDTIFVPAIEFWSTFAETMVDYIYSDEESSDRSWEAPANTQLLQAVSHAWQKITFPPAEEFGEWDSADRAAFKGARQDVVDLLQTTFTLTGPSLVYTFAELSITAMNDSAWLRLEAAIFCLGGLADCIEEDPRCDEALSSVFDSPLFALLQSPDSKIPSRVRQTSVSLIEDYTDYFERHVARLPPALGLLFSVLNESRVAVTASKSIFWLCSSCRHHLHAQLDAFLEEYRRMTSARCLDCISSERLLGAIGSVCQAEPDPASKYAHQARMLDSIQEDVKLAAHLVNARAELPCAGGARCFEESSDESPALHVALRALRCLACFAKASRAPYNVAISLDGDDTTPAPPDERLVQLQRQVIGIILDVQDKFGTSSEVIGLISGILRSGFAENDPGPFVLPAADVAEYITRHGIDTPRVAVLVGTACSFVSSLTSVTEERKGEILRSLLLWVIGLLKQVSNFESDPELSQNAIDFVTRLLSASPRTLLQLEHTDAVEFFFLHTLEVLEGREPLPKASSTDFWSTFLSLKGQEADLQTAVTQAMDTLGPALAVCLARNLGGGASRSELDKLSEPLKKLVSRYPKAKQWLEAGLSDPSFPSTRVSDQEKSIFVKKLISLRGARGTNQVVREFWLSARGSNFAYAS